MGTYSFWHPKDLEVVPHPAYSCSSWHPKDLEVVPHPKVISHINNDMNINIHIDINMNIDIHIIINMNTEDYKRYYLLLLGIPYLSDHVP